MRYDVLQHLLHWAFRRDLRAFYSACSKTTYAHHIPKDSNEPRWQKLRAAMLASRKVQSFTGHTIDALQHFHERLGFWPKLVYDRGFANESMLTHLHAEGAIFYVRLKAGR